MSSSRVASAWLVPLAVAGAFGCAPPPEGLAPTPDGDGPVVVFDFDRRPLPEVPLPNDIATRHDPSSPTGLRINASLLASTVLERTARKRIDELSGWGVYQPITVSFDAPLDLEVFYQRHRDHRRGNHEDYDFANDAVYLIDVSPGSPDFLQPVPLDFGEGNFPILLRTPTQYWEHDPKTITHALTYETFEEDANGNGHLDPGEDIDLDGVLDHPNVYGSQDGDSKVDPIRDLISFYEMETDTLIFKPILPLREGNKYAVVITNRVLGTNGDPIRSPFEYVNHAAQTADIEPVVSALASYGLDEHDVAFAWSFTTQKTTDDMVNLRDGLYGDGPLAWLAEDIPPELTKLFAMQDEVHAVSGKRPDNVYLMPTETLQVLLRPLAAAAFSGFGIGDVEKLVVNHDFYAYHVSGKFTSPNLLDLVDSGTLDERAWPANLLDPTLRDRVRKSEVQFWCAIPRDEFKADPNKPAPVVLYAHGYTSNKIEQLGLALHAKFGIAGCSIDAVLHGVNVPMEQAMLAQLLLTANGVAAAYEPLTEHRMVDMDGDGDFDSGGEFFTGYMFRTRDNLRQTLLDYLSLVRLIRSFGSTEMLDVNGDGKAELLGDFDADGQIDIGGPDNVFFASGTSLGGLVSSMLSGIEPSVVAAAPISGGAGLIDLSIRSEQGGVVEALMLRMLGPAFVGKLNAAGEMRVYQLFANGNQDARYDVAFVQGVRPGDIVRVTNTRSGAARCARVMPMAPPPGYEGYVGWGGSTNCSVNDAGGCAPCEAGTEGTYACDLAGSFRVAVAADRGDPIAIDFFGGGEVAYVDGDERDCTIEDDAPLHAAVRAFDAAPFRYRGVDYRNGDELVALEDGFGFQRATPLLRRFTGIASIAVEGADPALYATHYSRDLLKFREGGKEFTKAPTNVLNVTTIGDANVPVNTGVAIAKVAGFIGLTRPDPRWEKTPNRVIIDEGVQAGIPWVATHPDWGPVLVDPDNLSESSNTAPGSLDGSIDGFVAPRVTPPLRNIVTTAGTDNGLSGIIFPMLDEYDGRHGFPPPGLSDLPFDVGQYMEHFIGAYFQSLGTRTRYEPCMAELAGCDWIPPPPVCVSKPETAGC